MSEAAARGTDAPFVGATLAIFASTPATLRALLGGLPEAVTNAAGPEGWSPRDVVAHLASLHEHTLLARVNLMLDHELPILPSFDEHAVLEESGLRGQSADELIDMLEQQYAEAMPWLRALTPAEFARRGRHAVAGELSVADIIHHKTYHDLLHIRQICTLLAAPIELARGRCGRRSRTRAS